MRLPNGIDNRRGRGHHVLLLFYFIGIAVNCCRISAVPIHNMPLNEIPTSCENSVPLITPGYDSLQLEAYTNYELKCKADEPITWILAQYNKLLQDEFQNSQEKERPYNSILKLENATYLNVRRHYCVKKSEVLKYHRSLFTDKQLMEMVNNNKATSIYIYVNDKSHLLARNYNFVINAEQFSNAVFPCKPTMPDIEVFLIFPQRSTNTNFRISSLSPNDVLHKFYNMSDFDPQTGFTLHIVDWTPSDATCCAQWKGNNADDDNDKKPDCNYVHIYYIPKYTKPVVTSTSRGHVYEGGDFELVCELSAPSHFRYTIDWIVPKTAKQKHVRNNYTSHFDETNKEHPIGRKIITVHDAQRSESGIYTCEATDRNGDPHTTNYFMKIMDFNSSYLEMTKPFKFCTFHGKINRTIQIIANFQGYPQPSVKWFTPDNSEIFEKENKFEIELTEKSTLLRIRNAQVVDSGRYIVKGTNGYDTRQLEFNVRISAEPIVTMQDVYVQKGHKAHLSCHVVSYLIAMVTWVFQPCSIEPHWPSCNNKVNQTFASTGNARPGELSNEYIYDLEFTPDEPGIIMCMAQSKKIETTYGKAQVLIGDIPENMTIYRLDESREIARGDKVNFTCAALVYHFSGELKWYFNGDPLVVREGIKEDKSRTQYSYTNTLNFESIGYEDLGTYQCRANYNNEHDVYEAREVNVLLHELIKFSPSPNIN